MVLLQPASFYYNMPGAILPMGNLLTTDNLNNPYGACYSFVTNTYRGVKLGNFWARFLLPSYYYGGMGHFI